ncbi:MAG: 5'-methylthioadenosine/adenosylhomocysteine nucleosidase [Bacteroidales bacterium]
MINLKHNRIGIIVAMSKEFDLVKMLLEDVESKTILGFEFAVGRIGRKEIFLQKCGIGKVNSAIATVEMIRNFSPDCIINTGVAGGLDRTIDVSDIVVGSETTYHDFYCGDVGDHIQELGYPEFIKANDSLVSSLKLSSSSNSSIKFGLICTGDQFITKISELEAIKSKHSSALAVDMESNSIAHACFMYKVPFVSFRIISDTPWVDNHDEQYLNFWNEAPQKTFSLLSDLLSQL